MAPLLLVLPHLFVKIPVVVTLDQRGHSNRSLRFPPPANSRLLHEPDFDWVCAILGEAQGHGFTANPRGTMSLPVLLLPQWFTGFHIVTVISLPVIPRK
jgi:hypothetical protein